MGKIIKGIKEQFRNMRIEEYNRQKKNKIES